MSKKNRRKTIARKEEVIRKGEFSIDDSKAYIIFTIVMFHILPLFFVMMGDNGQTLLLQTFLMMLNPMFIAISGLVYGIKKGFNFKYPIFMTIIAALSIPMYYEFDAGAYMAQTTFIMGIVYLVFAAGSAAIGGFVKKLLNF